MVKIRKPSAREFQYERPICLVMGGNCSDSCEQIDINGKRNNCSNCKIALEHKNRKEGASCSPLTKEEKE